MNELDNNLYKEFFNEVIGRINSARIEAYKSVNYQQIRQNYDIGRMIVEKQSKFGWGKSVVEKLSKDINQIYDGIEGYSSANLWNMRQFYTEYCENTELLELALNIPWSHNILIMNKIKDFSERKYYLFATQKLAWSRAVLLNQIKASAYEHHLKNPKQNNFDLTLPEHFSEQANEAMKSVYTLDFIGITKPVLEREMENMLIAKIRDFIMELGYGFCYIGNQYKIILNNKSYKIDLLFYHRVLKCMVILELKTVEFEPEFAGKMNFYIDLVDSQLKQVDDNPTIGIIMCPEKDNFEVEFALKSYNKPIGVAEYRLTKELPENLIGKFPTVDEIKQKFLSVGIINRNDKKT